MKRINIHLTEKQIKILQSQSKFDGLSVAEHARRAIDKYIKELQGDYNNRNVG